jgi:hypothetical protein
MLNKRLFFHVFGSCFSEQDLSKKSLTIAYCIHNMDQRFC